MSSIDILQWKKSLERFGHFLTQKNDTESQNFAIFDIKLISKINFGAQFTHVLTVFEDHRESSQLWPPQQMAEVS